jgi:di/tricarboxylate transporter
MSSAARSPCAAGLASLVLEPGDRIVVKTDAGEILGMKANGAIAFRDMDESGLEPVTADRTVTMEASVGPNSPLAGRQVLDLRLRRKYGVYLMAVHREEQDISENLQDLRLQFADTLLLEGPPEGLRRMIDDGGIINLTEPLDRPLRREKAPIAIAAILGVMALAAIGAMPIAGLAVIGAVVVMVTRCVDPEEAFDAIDWRILFLIFGMLGLSMGMERTGAGRVLVEGVVGLVGDIGPLAVLAAVYILTSVLTEMISNNAVAVLVGPIAIALAQQLGFDPRPFVIAVMFAASASFADADRLPDQHLRLRGGRLQVPRLPARGPAAQRAVRRRRGACRALCSFRSESLEQRSYDPDRVGCANSVWSPGGDL